MKPTQVSKSTKALLGLFLTAMLPQLASALLVGPYTPDTNTLVLLHLDEPAGSSATTNTGSLGGNFYSVNYSTAVATPPVVTTMLGAAGFSSGGINFTNCENNNTAGYELGYDYNRNGQYDADSGTGTSVDFLTMATLNIGNGGQKTPFTLEALIQPTTTAGNQEIICTDSDAGNRGFQFRITSGSLQFQFIAGSQAVSATIPTSGSDAFAAGTWYHVAVVFDGTNATLYWTMLNSANGAAHVLGTPAALNLTNGTVTGPLVIGNRGRPSGSETFLGSIDEVRISKVARAANQMQFFSPLVTITQNPISQNVDYNQPVTLSVGASSLTTLGYQWLFNSNSVPNATNAAYVIPNVGAANAGYYDCVVTNTSGNAATSSPALLVVGAANFLNHRYSFTTDDTDSIGGANGTNFGDATVSGGELVLDGTAGTFMQLPPNLFNAANATALTVEFWATYGANANNAYVFSFGYTNYIIGSGLVGIDYVAYSPHNANGQGLLISPSDSSFQQSVTAPGTLDGSTWHVACVIDPPNKTISIYTNGILEAANTNMTVALANVNDALSYIGGSLFAADPTLAANIDELRLYNGALSAISIKQSDDQGPNVVLADGPAKFVTQPANSATPLGQPATFTATTVGYLPITYQWFKNGILVPGATNTSYSFVPALTDNNASIEVFATNTIGVTTYVTNSTTATLTVFIPPTVAWLDSSHGGADNSWNTTSLDWTNNVNSIVAFTQTNGALFDDRGAGSPDVDIGQAIVPYNITVNSASDYIFFSSAQVGSLNGLGALTKQNSDTLTIDLTNNLTGPTTISGGKLQIGDFDSYGTLGSGQVTNNGTLSFTRGDTILAVPNPIHGSGTVSFDGSGATTISGPNDYTGPTLLNSGIVFLTSSTGLGATSSGTIVADGAQLYITANVNIGPEGLSLGGAGDGNGALRKGGAGATTYYGAITLADDTTIGVDSGATLTLSNSITGAAALTMSGSGTLALGTPNGYTGGTVLSGPVVDVDANGALGSGLVTVNNTGRFVIADGLNFTNPVDATTVSPGTATGLLMVNDNTNGTITTISGPLEFDATAVNGGDFQGPITSGYLNVTGPVINPVTGVVSSRNGFVRFSGGGNYSQFNLNQGTASLGANNGLSTNTAMSIAASGAATFDLNGFSQALTALFDVATPQPNAELVTNSGTSPGTLALNLTSAGVYSGVIGGNLTLVVNGSGALDLAGTNTYTGNTTVNGGTLEIGLPTLAPTSTVTVANGATLQLDFSTTNNVAALVLNGAGQPLGVYNSATSPSFISGPGNLLVTVPVATTPTNITTSVSGTNLTLSWPANYTGWRLLVQTNNLANGLSTRTNDWGTVNGSAATNLVNITIDRTKPAEFYRMVYP